MAANDMHEPYALNDTRSLIWDRTEAPPLSAVTRRSRVMVTHLTRNVTKEHLSEIFGKYGAIKELFLPVSHVSTRYFVLEFS